MPAIGTYELACRCETCAREQIFVANTRLEALDTARTDGWMITRTRQSYCSEHRPGRER